MATPASPSSSLGYRCLAPDLRG
ncbi:hypothetical protein NC651_018490 [Populus alba x Populus x berolinensis]|nr:hypothetical protein NC651_018490 [Populus alba x Populus x berolinensis]